MTPRVVCPSEFILTAVTRSESLSSVSHQTSPCHTKRRFRAARRSGRVGPSTLVPNLERLAANARRTRSQSCDRKRRRFRPGDVAHSTRRSTWLFSSLRQSRFATAGAAQSFKRPFVRLWGQIARPSPFSKLTHVESRARRGPKIKGAYARVGSVPANVSLSSISMQSCCFGLGKPNSAKNKNGPHTHEV